MLDRKLIRNNPELVREGCKHKGINAPIDDFLEIDQERRSVIQELEYKKAELNKLNKQHGHLFAQKQMIEIENIQKETLQLKTDIKSLELVSRNLEAKLQEIELQLPNIPHHTTPIGLTSEDNVVIRTWGIKPQGNFISHKKIAEDLKIIDFNKATKISGTGFVVYTGLGAKLVRALINFMLDFHVEKHGYYEVYPPALVNSNSLMGTGNLPKFTEDLYKTKDNLWLVPTAEVPVTNLLRDEILENNQLPVKYVAYTPCFRREAGAAGKDTRGILRMHQFDKVEMVQFVHPNESNNALEDITNDAEAILQALGLHYRVVLLCSGDMGDKGSKCYDLEVWAPGENRYLEVSSCTNFESFQSRRINTRFRPAPGQSPEFVHILNGSGLAVPRLMVALLETYRQQDGSIILPESLHDYMKMDKITT